MPEAAAEVEERGGGGGGEAFEEGGVERVQGDGEVEEAELPDAGVGVDAEGEVALCGGRGGLVWVCEGKGGRGGGGGGVEFGREGGRGGGGGG